MVLMQLCSPPGLESTAFTLMQSSGTIGSVLGRNLEYSLMARCGVNPALGYDGFQSFAKMAVAVLVWRGVTAALLIGWLLPPLRRLLKADTDHDSDSDIRSEPSMSQIRCDDDGPLLVE
eukprot:CAMPEP_0195034562 /NCGR_PEP_ID=MMETSP0326_2-20130528/68158_1 /TAXON_ID=2866 ORGANISM="Crypthecodinium cohnii, Strain Seligo" /NCGR_SAMPLE_ID=MMETSP0326_2 /ASSEMBLY_ACC=CAM_ASM_000348 /LENGTH=118 /DNA_ID=CAMNT_0040059429 /DNA_START=119 /DNA_END=472 /DNA_ORIENTATION=-